MRDIRIDNALFWPHMKNTSYEAFFQQITSRQLPSADAGHLAASFFTIQREEKNHPILDLENRLASVLAHMEVTGVYVESSVLKELETELLRTIWEIESVIALETGETRVNLASPLQLQKLLFETKGIKPIRKTKTGWSVDEETLHILAVEHDICNKILTHRHASKLLSTYVRGLLKCINPQTHRVHTSYDTLGAATGRLSSDSPNLQNIPAGDVWSDAIKGAFRPAQVDWSYVVADYSQIEIRILACLSGDEHMLQIFRDSRDLHAETAKYIFQKADISREERRLAKAVNFGVMYGITGFGLSRMITQTPAESTEYIQKFFTLYPETRSYFDHIIAETERVGYAETFFGRRRMIRGLNDRNSLMREAAKREAMNMPIQGTCADILKYALIGIHEVFQKNALQARILMSVHDEIVVECPDTECDRVSDLMRSVMEGIVQWEIPMTVEIGIGKTWRDAK